MDKPFWMWAVFLTIVLALLVADLGFFHKKDREIGVKESLWLSLFYMGVAIIFGFWIWHQLGLNSFSEYLTGFLVEKSLAVDNIFLISLVFSSLSIPRKYQHRVLFWGILGVILLRGIMIGLGAQLVSQFSWVLYIFSLFMVLLGVKMLYMSGPAFSLENRAIKYFRNHIRVTEKLHEEKFFVRIVDNVSNKKLLYVTPLFLALIIIEFIDLIFAVDSIPAIFTITQDPYIVYTSNIFAILGLRALYFALSEIIERFHYLKYALAGILIFIGSKIFIADALGIEKIPPTFSLSITFLMLLIGCGYSLYKTNNEKR